MKTTVGSMSAVQEIPNADREKQVGDHRTEDVVEESELLNANEQKVDNIIIGVLGDPYFRKSPFCDALSMREHVASRYSIYKNKYIETRLGNKNAIIIDIECAQKYHSKAINAIADCDVIIYVISVMRQNDEKSDKLMRRYLEITHIFGVKHFIIAITKMEFVPFAQSQDVFGVLLKRKLSGKRG